MTLKYDLERNMETENKYHYTPLPEPIPITEQEWPDDVLPLVHTRTMTFMHEKFIRECIDGILMQKTTFPVRVLIHDDASTDDTANIVREYGKKYPRLIQAYYQTENSYSKKDKYERRAEFHKWRIGKYEALCEGDDYWTDSLKLQKQVDFLESHPEYSLCGHNTKIVYENDGGRVEYFRPHRSKQTKTELDMDDMIVDFHSFHTSSFMFRCSMLETPQWFSKCRSGDIALSHMLASKGPVYYIDEVMSVYRTHDGGITQNNTREAATRWHENWLYMNRVINRHLKNKYVEAFQKRNEVVYIRIFHYILSVPSICQFPRLIRCLFRYVFDRSANTLSRTDRLWYTKMTLKRFCKGSISYYAGRTKLSE